jgi:hypothetical protein
MKAVWKFESIAKKCLDMILIIFYFKAAVRLTASSTMTTPTGAGTAKLLFLTDN